MIVGRGLYGFPLNDLYRGSLYIIGCLGRDVIFEIIQKRKSKYKKAIFYWNGQVQGWSEMNSEIPIIKRYLKAENLIFDSAGNNICKLNGTQFRRWQLETEYGKVEFPFNSMGEVVPLLDNTKWKEYFMTVTFLYFISSQGFDA